MPAPARARGPGGARHRGPAGPPGINGAQLLRELEPSGWSRREFAHRLGVDPEMLGRWVRKERPIPDLLRQAIDDLLRRIDPRSALRAHLVVAVDADPRITFEELTRGQFWRGRLVEEALTAAVHAGELRQAPSVRTNRASVSRSQQGFYLQGAASPVTDRARLTGAELELLCRDRRLSQRGLARLAKVTKTQISHRVSGRQPIPEWRDLQLIESVPAAEPLVRLALREVHAQVKFMRR